MNVAHRRRFSQIFSPYYTLRKFLIFGHKSMFNFCYTFFQKSVQYSPDNTLKNF